MGIHTLPARSPALRLTWSSAFIALVALTGALLIAGFTLQRTPAQAAAVSIDQCNNIGPGAMGATTAMTCTVDVVNVINGGNRSSTVTVTRLCGLDPCPPGNGSVTTSYTDVVTSVTQCNGSDNDAAHPITCTVNIINNISADTPGAQPVTAATVNQCVGTGGGGGQFGAIPAISCAPFPANTSGATVVQCNGSVTGGGSSAVCSVGTASEISPAIPIQVNQCNGTGNAGGTLLTCDTNITTNITPAVVPTPAPTNTGTPAATPTRHRRVRRPEPDLPPRARLTPPRDLEPGPARVRELAPGLALVRAPEQALGAAPAPASTLLRYRTCLQVASRPVVVRPLARTTSRCWHSSSGLLLAAAISAMLRRRVALKIKR